MNAYHKNLLIALATASALFGCQSPPQAGPASVERGHGESATGQSIPADGGPLPSIDSLHLEALHTAVNWDGNPGPDGVQARILFFRIDDPLAVALERGTIEFLLFEGRVIASELADVEPLRVWPFNADALRPLASRSIIGWNYPVALPWGPTPPKTAAVTLTARLLRPDRQPLYAHPVHLAVAVK